MLSCCHLTLHINSISLTFRLLFTQYRTSGARISVIEQDASSSSGFQEVYSEATPWDKDYDDPDTWMNVTEKLLLSAANALGNLDSIASICVSGTSASCLLVDRETQAVTRSARMYNYDVVSNADEGSTAGSDAVELLEKHAPPRHTARALTGSLAKLLTWAIEKPLTDSEALCRT